MQKRQKKISLPLVVLLVIVLFSWSTAFAYRGGSGVPSCHDDLAVNKTEPGTSPLCTPPIIDEETSLKFLKESTVKRIKKKWYLFLSPENFQAMDAAARWKTISLLISAVESKFGEKADCFIVRIPETSEEKQALLQGDYPQKLTAAGAQRTPLSAEEEKEKKWPEYHHHLLYKITVY